MTSREGAPLKLHHIHEMREMCIRYVVSLLDRIKNNRASTIIRAVFSSSFPSSFPDAPLGNGIYRNAAVLLLEKTQQLLNVN